MTGFLTPGVAAPIALLKFVHDPEELEKLTMDPSGCVDHSRDEGLLNTAASISLRGTILRVLVSGCFLQQ